RRQSKPPARSAKRRRTPPPRPLRPPPDPARLAQHSVTGLPPRTGRNPPGPLLGDHRLHFSIQPIPADPTPHHHTRASSTSSTRKDEARHSPEDAPIGASPRHPIPTRKRRAAATTPASRIVSTGNRH